ncbi:aldehyde dehydrogenase-like isoform X2 [Tubulanus polymorphus]|uniref:aldehyde dehydrogenase-like isoform X2 n=1 Tax=Tubulanus polymorphus TaxID=672921 RepID=UPI003DA600CD
MATPIRNPEIKYTKLFINNEFVDAASGKTFATINPTNEEEIAQIAAGDKADVDKAVAAAKAAFDPDSEWRQMKPADRAGLMHKLADLIERDRAIFASLETVDMGKPFTIAYNEDIQAGINAFRYFAGWCDKVTGETIPSEDGKFLYTRYEPVGVCGLIAPWNFPFAMNTLKVSACVSMGNTCILKPAEQSPLTALHLAALVKEAGFPPGVINIIPGFGPTAGSALTHHHDINKVSFTGSTIVGRKIQQASSETNLKRVALELGGKSPLIVFPDFDLDACVCQAHEGAMYNTGQVCCAPTRTFVHESIYDKFVAKTVEYAKNRVVGDPFDEKTQMGPQVSKVQFDKVIDLIESGKKEGAKLEIGGNRLCNKGYFVEPTVFSDVQDHMRIAKEEIFGPVQSIFKFSTIDEVIRRANDTDYGLAAFVFTKDINTAIYVSNRLQAGTINVNSLSSGSGLGLPFGGYKQSGIGREYGKEGVHEYCEVKSVSISVPQSGLLKC